MFTFTLTFDEKKEKSSFSDSFQYYFPLFSRGFFRDPIHPMCILLWNGNKEFYVRWKAMTSFYQR